MCEHLKTVFKHMNSKLTELKRIGKPTMKTGDFNISLPAIDKQVNKSIRKKC